MTLARINKKTIAASASSAFAFVFAMGIVNLFADMTYEGGASINGPFLGTLGASAAAISIIAGAGEFLGYSLRSVAGYVADKTGEYWLITFFDTASICSPSPRWRSRGAGTSLVPLFLRNERDGPFVSRLWKRCCRTRLANTAGVGYMPSTRRWMRHFDDLRLGVSKVPGEITKKHRYLE